MDRRAFRYILPYWRRLGVVLAISLAGTLLALYLPYLSKSLIDDALVGRNAAALWRILTIFLVAGAASFGLNVVSGLKYTRVSAEILFDMRRDLYEHLQKLSPRFYAATRLGDIVSRLNNDIGEIQRIAAETALAWVGNVLFLVGSVAVLIWLDWRMFLVGLVPLPLAAWALIWSRRRLEAGVANLRARSADIGSFLIETLAAMRTVVIAGAERREVSRFTRLNDAFIATLMGVQRVQYLAGGVPTLLLSAGATSVFVYGGWRVVNGTLSIGTLGAVMAYQSRLAGPVQALVGLYNALATARVAWRRVREILDTPAEVTERPDALPIADVRGEVAFEDVSLSHGRGAAVLDRVSFRAGAGETLAIVGASGSGKSTIADLVVRLLDPDSGVVTLDGRDLRTLRLADLRRHVRVVEQDPALFQGSIDDNVRYASPGASDADVAAALAAAGLKHFVDALPERGRTLVGDRGLALSAGERQRIGIARALVTRPSVLVLDEPSAALDPVSERHVIDGYRGVMRGRTTLVISHRLEIVRAADRVIVLDGARVAETGMPAELAESGGAFASLFGLSAARSGPVRS